MERTLRERARDATDNAVIAFAESLRESVVELGTRPKYVDAERVAIGVVDERIDAITKKSKPTQKDKDLLEVLKGIKSEMQEALDARWNNRESTQEEFDANPRHFAAIRHSGVDGRQWDRSGWRSGPR